MSADPEALTEDEISQIEALIKALDQSSCEFLQVEIGALKVTLSKNVLPPDPASSEPAERAPPVLSVAAPVAERAPEKSATGAIDDGTVPIHSPMMGRFYCAPEPGMPPFVSLGQRVSADTTVGLIEVMKVFTAVRAGVDGVISEICVNDAGFVEYQDIIFRVRPS